MNRYSPEGSRFAPTVQQGSSSGFASFLGGLAGGAVSAAGAKKKKPAGVGKKLMPASNAPEPSGIGQYGLGNPGTSSFADQLSKMNRPNGDYSNFRI